MTTNGNVPASDLVEIEGLLLERETAADYVAWRSAALRAGHIMNLAHPGGGYRSFALQGAMRAAYLARNYAAYNLSPPPSPAPAVAGLSRHGFGRAVDIADAIGPGTFRDWVRRTAATYGFHLWTTTDPNHFEHGNALTAAALDVTSLDNTNPIHSEDPDMPKIIVRNDGTAAAPARTYALFDGEHWEETSDESLAGKWGQLYNDGNSARDITGNPGAIAAWNYRSNLRPDLKKPFGVTSTSAGSDAAVLAAVAALGKQEATDQAALLAAISQVDENTLATFGLKRA